MGLRLLVAPPNMINLIPIDGGRLGSTPKMYYYQYQNCSFIFFDTTCGKAFL